MEFVKRVPFFIGLRLENYRVKVVVGDTEIQFCRVRIQ